MLLEASSKVLIPMLIGLPKYSAIRERIMNRTVSVVASN